MKKKIAIPFLIVFCLFILAGCSKVNLTNTNNSAVNGAPTEGAMPPEGMTPPDNDTPGAMPPEGAPADMGGGSAPVGD